MKHNYDLTDPSPIPKKIQIEITTKCNMGCKNCDRSCGQAPTDEHMSLFQIKGFVKEALDNNFDFDRIDIMGGEPTLHPELFEIIEELKVLKNNIKNKKCTFRLSTNGVSGFTISVLNKLPSWIKIRNSNKKSGQLDFESYNLAPIDYNIDNAPCCNIPWRCGMGLSSYGFYPCGAGASLDRVFRFNIGTKNLISINSNSIQNQFNILCKYCGHSPTKIRQKIKNAILSKSWIEAYKKYNSGEIKAMELIY